LYTFHFTQPPSLYKVDFVPMPLDWQAIVVHAPARFTGAMATTVQNVVSRLSPHFRVTLESKYLPPLPTSTLERAPESMIKKTGRPTEASKKHNYKVSVQLLQDGADELGTIISPDLPSADDYVGAKEDMLRSMSPTQLNLVAESSRQTANRMKAIEKWAKEHKPDLQGWDWEGEKRIGLDLITRNGSP